MARMKHAKIDENFTQMMNRLESESPPRQQYYSPVREKTIVDTAGREWILGKTLLSKAAALALVDSADLMILGKAPLGLQRTELETKQMRRESFAKISADYYDDDPQNKRTGDMVYYGYTFTRADGHVLLYIEEECVP